MEDHIRPSISCGGFVIRLNKSPEDVREKGLVKSVDRALNLGEGKGEGCSGHLWLDGTEIGRTPWLYDVEG